MHQEYHLDLFQKVARLLSSGENFESLVMAQCIMIGNASVKELIIVQSRAIYQELWDIMGSSIRVQLVTAQVSLIRQLILVSVLIILLKYVSDKENEILLRI